MSSSRNFAGRKRPFDDDDPTGKKEKNREAARKCREKKVKETNDLKEKNSELIAKNKELNDRMRELRRILQEYVLEIKKHRSSGCVLPQKVERIINSPELYQELLHVECPANPNQANLSEVSTRTEGFKNDTDTESDISVEDMPPQLPIQGLFTGQQLPVTTVERTRTRHGSSRSSSGSPPAPSASSTNGHHLVRSSLSSASLASSSSSNVNGIPISKLSWAQLHQTVNSGKVSPGLSPVHTVPNIDTYTHQNGFPDIAEAVQYAQRDPGVMEDPHNQPSSYNRFLTTNSTSTGVENGAALFSTGFTPTCSSSDSEQKASKNSAQGVPFFQETLKPPASGSTEVLSIHTAELLSQAIANFDGSEISEDLKKQYNQLAKCQENEAEGSSVDQGYATNENNAVVQYQHTTTEEPVTQVAAQEATGNEMTYANLLRLAREFNTVTVQYQGTEYNCTYEQVEQLIKYMTSQQAAVESVDERTNNPNENCYVDESTVPLTVETSSLVTQTTSAQFFQQNHTSYSLQNDIPATNASLIDNDVNVSTLGASVQTTQLPTTVLSMMEEDNTQPPPLQNQPPTPIASYQETVYSVDYSQNVSDLPSLSLTEVVAEDHPNIFEKRRRNP